MARCSTGPAIQGKQVDHIRGSLPVAAAEVAVGTEHLQVPSNGKAVGVAVAEECFHTEKSGAEVAHRILAAAAADNRVFEDDFEHEVRNVAEERLFEIDVVQLVGSCCKHLFFYHPGN